MYKLYKLAAQMQLSLSGGASHSIKANQQENKCQKQGSAPDLYLP